MKRTTSTILALIFLLGLTTTAAFSVPDQENEALKGLKSFKAVFDFRIGGAQGALMYLNLIHETYKGKEVAMVTKKPEFVVVFLGPSVKLISSEKEGFSGEDQKVLDAIAGKISEMAQDGIRLEVCLLAARMLEVDPETILTDINQVESGVISLIGYQAKGHGLLPIY